MGSQSTLSLEKSSTRHTSIHTSWLVLAQTAAPLELTAVIHPAAVTQVCVSQQSPAVILRKDAVKMRRARRLATPRLVVHLKMAAVKMLQARRPATPSLAVKKVQTAVTRKSAVKRENVERRRRQDVAPLRLTAVMLRPVARRATACPRPAVTRLLTAVEMKRRPRLVIRTRPLSRGLKNSDF